MRTHIRANNDYMLIVETEAMLGGVQMEQQFLAGEEPNGVGRQNYLVIRWQRQGIRFVSCGNPTRSTLQHVSRRSQQYPSSIVLPSTAP